MSGCSQLVHICAQLLSGRSLGKFQSWNCKNFLTAADYVDDQDAGADADVCADTGADAGVGHVGNLTFSRGVNISQS